jgi:hypothetical protein
MPRKSAQGEGQKMRKAEKETLRLVDEAQSAIRDAVKGCERERAEKLNDLIILLLLLLETFKAFQMSRTIKDGVASRLNMNRNGVYFRLERLGLNPHDLWDDDATVESLAQKSETIAPLLTDLFEWPAIGERPASTTAKNS